jgi:hypothetical protein
VRLRNGPFTGQGEGTRGAAPQVKRGDVAELKLVKGGVRFRHRGRVWIRPEPIVSPEVSGRGGNTPLECAPLQEGKAEPRLIFGIILGPSRIRDEVKAFGIRAVACSKETQEQKREDYLTVSVCNLMDHGVL